MLPGVAEGGRCPDGTCRAVSAQLWAEGPRVALVTQGWLCRAVTQCPCSAGRVQEALLRAAEPLTAILLKSGC